MHVHVHGMCMASAWHVHGTGMAQTWHVCSPGMAQQPPRTCTVKQRTVVGRLVIERDVHGKVRHGAGAVPVGVVLVPLHHRARLRRLDERLSRARHRVR